MVTVTAAFSVLVLVVLGIVCCRAVLDQRQRQRDYAEQQRQARKALVNRRPMADIDHQAGSPWDSR